MGLWIAAYMALLRYFVPRARMRSLKVADTRSVSVGRVVDSYTNILTVKLFARGAEERSAVRDAIAAHTRAFLNSFRLITGVDVVADGHEQRPARRDRRSVASCCGRRAR